MDIQPKVLRPRQAAEYLGLKAKASIYKLASEGKICKPHRLSYKHSVWFITELDEYLQKQPQEKQ